MKPKYSTSEDQSRKEHKGTWTEAQLTESDRKMRRRVEDLIRKDREALHLVARVLNIS